MGKYDWNSLATKLKDNTFEEKRTYEEDSRFYKLSKDENGVGGALIRFLTDPTDLMFIKMTLINAQQGKGKRFIAMPSPTTIGKPDPINEKFSALWKEGLHEEAKKYGRKFRWYTNIKVIKDPANPENDGKYFLFDMPKTLFDKLTAAASPSETDAALEDATPVAVYDPINGNSFLLKTKTGSNGFLTYEDSKFSDKPSPIFKDDATAETEIKENTFSLEEFYDESNFATYDELKLKLNWFDGENVSDVETPATSEVKQETPATPATPEVKQETPTSAPEEADEDMDALLSDLMAEE